MVTWIEGWLWDVRIAGRALTRRPAVSLLVVGTLALGIGANSTIYGALDRIVLDPLPFDGADRAVYVMSREEARGFVFSTTQAQYERWRAAARTLEGLEAFQPVGGVVVRGDDVEELDGAAVSIGLAHMVGAVPVAGRLFTTADADPGAPAVVMLSEAYWRTRLGSTPEAIGSTLVISDVERTVVGVWPGAARFRIEDQPSFLIPLERGAEIDRSFFSVAMGLLAPGVSHEEAQAELTALSHGVDENPARRADRAEVPVVLPVHTFIASDFIRALWILFAGVGLLVLVAGVNSANLLLNRAVDREEELGVRMALGGASARLLRHFLVEGALLAGAGAVAGTLLARYGTVALSRLAPSDVSSAALAGGGTHATSYALGVVVVLTLICGLVPALHLRSPGVRRLVSQGNSGGRRRREVLKSVLVAGQVAFAAMLVIGSGLTLRSLERVNAIDFGFETEELLVVTVRFPPGRVESEAERRPLVDRVRADLTGLPGVRSVSASGVLPLSYSIRFGTPYLEGEEPSAGGDASFTQSASSSSGFLMATGIPLIEGRDFTDAEREQDDARVVLVNHGFASRYGESVLGRTLLHSGDSIGRRIVGVVGDVRTGNVKDATVRAQVYYPGDGVMSGRSQRYLVRVAGPTTPLPGLIRARVREIDPGLLVPSVSTGAEMVADRTTDSRFLATVLSLLGGFSLMLALTGVYGSVLLNVGRRTREMGIRIALGAHPTRVTRRVVLDGMRAVLLGLVVGLGIAALAVRYLADVLYEVSPRDPLSFLLTALVLMLAAGLAALVPARRAAAADPREALRAE